MGRWTTDCLPVENAGENVGKLLRQVNGIRQLMIHRPSRGSMRMGILRIPRYLCLKVCGSLLAWFSPFYPAHTYASIKWIVWFSAQLSSPLFLYVFFLFVCLIFFFSSNPHFSPFATLLPLVSPLKCTRVACKQTHFLAQRRRGWLAKNMICPLSLAPNAMPKYASFSFRWEVCVGVGIGMPSVLQEKQIIPASQQTPSSGKFVYYSVGQDFAWNWRKVTRDQKYFENLYLNNNLILMLSG